jgi:hypothetical protein
MSLDNKVQIIIFTDYYTPTNALLYIVLKLKFNTYIMH